MAKKIKEFVKRTIEQLVDAAAPRRSQRLDASGREVLDDTPIALPVHLRSRGSTLDEVRRAVGIINEEARRNDQETEEEFYDFDVDDELPLDTRWTAAASALDLSADDLRSYLGVPPPAEPRPVGTGTSGPGVPADQSRGAPDGDEPPKPPPAIAKQKTSDQ